MIQKPSLLVSAVNMIDELPITEGDAKGDLYEYLLSKLTTAGINGQFRTPRHIIRFMVELLEPEAHRDHRRSGLRHGGLPGRRDAVPAGDAHLARRASSRARTARRSTPATCSSRTASTSRASMFHGFDFDATMLRIAAMNLMLHGVDNPDIHYQDTLSQLVPGEVPQAGHGRLRRHPGQSAVQGQPRRGRRAPVAHAAR